MNPNDAPMTPSGRAIVALRIGIAVVAVAVAASWLQPRLATVTLSFTAATLGWLVVGVVAALAAGVVSGLWWWALLRVGGSDVTATTAVAAFLAGTSGKYLPGKVGTLALRALFLPAGSRLRASAIAAIETLTTMAVTAAVGGAWWLGIDVAVLLAIATLLAALLWLVAGRRPRLPRHLWAPLLVWPLQGLGLVAALGAAGAPLDGPLVAAALGASAGAVALAFVTPVPAGLGVRDLLVVELLVHGGFDGGAAAAGALLWRASTAFVDLTATAVGLLVRRWQEQSPPAS